MCHLPFQALGRCSEHHKINLCVCGAFILVKETESNPANKCRSFSLLSDALERSESGEEMGMTRLRRWEGAMLGSSAKASQRGERWRLGGNSQEASKGASRERTAPWQRSRTGGDQSRVLQESSAGRVSRGERVGRTVAGGRSGWRQQPPERRLEATGDFRTKAWHSLIYVFKMSLWQWPIESALLWYSNILRIFTYMLLSTWLVKGSASWGGDSYHWASFVPFCSACHAFFTCFVARLLGIAVSSRSHLHCGLWLYCF